MKRTLLVGVLLSSVAFLQACSCCCGTGNTDKLLMLLAGQTTDGGAESVKFVSAEDMLVVE
jgi:hypothetical protein